MISILKKNGVVWIPLYDAFEIIKKHSSCTKDNNCMVGPYPHCASNMFQDLEKIVADNELNIEDYI
jgi:hypothetical protein